MEPKADTKPIALLDIPTAVVSGKDVVHPEILATEIEIPNQSIGWIRAEIDPNQFFKDCSFVLTIESKTGDGEWEFRVGCQSKIIGITSGKHPEPFECCWGYNTNDYPYKGNKILARARLVTNGSFSTPITLERSQ